MLTTDDEFRRRLEAGVRHLPVDPGTREDLFEEAIVHACGKELENETAGNPACTQSWYLKNCLWFLKDRLGQGRSLDAYKRRHLACPLAEEAAITDEETPAYLMQDETLLAQVAFWDLIAQLRPRLNARQQDVLDELAVGSTPNEIARLLRISHQAAGKVRQEIAAQAVELGVGRPQRRAFDQ